MWAENNLAACGDTIDENADGRIVKKEDPWAAKLFI